jgi:hypothetical protein
VCSVCEATIKTETLTKLGHTDGEWITDKDATCTEDGSKHQVCSVCKATIKTETLTHLGHTDGEWIIDAEATCTADGSKHQICSVCNATLRTEALAMFGHDYTAQKPVKACVTKSVVYQCQHCKDTYSMPLQTISADIDYCYWSYFDSVYYVQDVISINGIQGGYGKYTVTITYVAPNGEMFAYTYENIADLYTVDYLGDASWEACYRQSCSPFVVIEIEDEIGSKTSYTAYFPTLNPESHADGYNFYAPDVAIDASTKATIGHDLGVTSYPTTCARNGYDEYACKNCDYIEIKEWDNMSCHVSLDYIGNAYLSQGFCYTYSLKIDIRGGGSKHFDSDAAVVIYDMYGANVSTIYPATWVNYDGSWSMTQTIYLVANWPHTIFVNIDTTAGCGLSCYYDVGSGTYTYEYNSLHKYNSVVTEPTKTEDGYTTHTCIVCGDSFKDSYVDAIGSVGLSYKVNEDGITCTITGIGTCEDEDIYIPTCIDGYTVTAIGEKVFENLAHVKSIHISKTVTDIANKAFYKCVSITEIRIPENVRCIGTQIFLGCESLTTVYYDSTYAPAEGETFIKNATIKKIVFGDNLTTIPNYICYNCDNLEEIILSPNTKYIGNYAFYYCQSVEKIDLPEGLLNTGWYAFYGWNITELIIPDSVTSIYNSFRDCGKLERIVMPTSIISVPNQTFYLCHAIKEVYYMGNELEWSAINISEDSSVLNRAVVYYYSDIQPANDGNYWHYVDGIPTIW